MRVAFEMGKKLDLGIDWLTAFSLFGFVDYGAVWNPPGRGGYEFASLGSAGGGFRARLGSHTMISTLGRGPLQGRAGARRRGHQGAVHRRRAVLGRPGDALPGRCGRR